MRDTFTLDPDYNAYQHGQTPLKHETTDSSPLSELVVTVAFTAILIVMCAGAVIWFQGFLGERDRWADTVSVQAETADCDIVWHEQSERPQIAYTYSVDGRDYTGSDIGGGDCLDYPFGVLLDVEAVRDDPATSRLETGLTGFWGWLVDAFQLAGIGIVILLMFVVVPLGILLGLYLMLHQLLGWYRHQRLVNVGFLLRGTVVRVEQKALASAESGLVRITVHYQFTNPNGQTLDRQQSRVRGAHSQMPPLPGTPVNVLYADDRAVILL